MPLWSHYRMHNLHLHRQEDTLLPPPLAPLQWKSKRAQVLLDMAFLQESIIHLSATSSAC